MEILLAEPSHRDEVNSRVEVSESDLFFLALAWRHHSLCLVEIAYRQRPD